MSIDLAAAQRRIRPQRPTIALRRRSHEALIFVTGPPIAGTPLMLDTSVYIDVLQGRTPPEVDSLLTTRLVHHSAICVAELTRLFGRLKPGHPRTAITLRELAGSLHDIRSHRLTSPSNRAFGEAGMLAGLVARLLGRPLAERAALLNDAMLYLHAIEQGCTVLTRNVRDFDYFDQLLPSGRVMFYLRR